LLLGCHPEQSEGFAVGLLLPSPCKQGEDVILSAAKDLLFAPSRNSAVHVLPVSDLENHHLVQFVINKINNPVLTLPHSVTIDVTCELFRSGRPGIAGETLNPLHDALPVCLGTKRLDFFCGRDFDQKAIFGHAVSGLGQMSQSSNSFPFFVR
jgi:hypothetical protein